VGLVERGEYPTHDRVGGDSASHLLPRGPGRPVAAADVLHDDAFDAGGGTCSVSQACAARRSRVTGVSATGGSAWRRKLLEVFAAGPVRVAPEVAASVERVERD
jgi:hypothetical protein